MKLFVDVGNTSMKWRLRDGTGCHQGSFTHDRDWSGVVSELARVAPASVNEVHVASVAGSEGDQLLEGELLRQLGITPRFHYSEASAGGVRNAYENPRRLGVDRWLAVLEAWHRHGPSVVIDCGSAMTIDAVAQGRHLGGYIVPGLAMLRGSLLQNTADVHLSSALPASLEPGSSTTEGVEHGILLMSVAFASRAVVELRRGLPDTCSVLLTGGDASRLESWLGDEVTLEPDLVLDGLERRVRMDRGE